MTGSTGRQLAEGPVPPRALAAAFPVDPLPQPDDSWVTWAALPGTRWRIIHGFCRSGQKTRQVTPWPYVLALCVEWKLPVVSKTKYLILYHQRGTLQKCGFYIFLELCLTFKSSTMAIISWSIRIKECIFIALGGLIFPSLIPEFKFSQPGTKAENFPMLIIF